MEYAVILRFDGKTEKKVSRLIDGVAKASANSCMTDDGIPPHVSLSIFSKENDAGLKDILTGFAERTDAFDLRFDSIGVFNPEVLFLAPVATSCLIGISAEINKKISGIASGLNGYYLPDRWVPHMALGIKMNPEELLKAFAALQKEFSPFSGKAIKIALVECCPYREVFCLNLREAPRLGAS